MANNKEVLLKVENLSQHFGSVKAVDDVSFEIYKGEVFGLVGESGCGKTTTGRSIIKIYDITSGSIYFKGQRICAGTKSYQDEIRQLQAVISGLKKNGTDDTAAKVQQCNEQIQALIKDGSAANKEKIQQLKQRINQIRQEGAPAAEKEIAQCRARISELRMQIRSAKFDHKYSDRVYSKTLRKRVDEKYTELIAHASADPQKVRELKKEYAAQRRIARKTKLITKIQMIFQDPIASLNPRMTVKEIVSEGLVINGIKDKKLIQNKVYEMLEMVGLVQEHASRYPHEFSGGQRQRIGIARSVIMKPELLIADEPVSALDVSVQAQVINLLNDLRDDLDLTILFIAHDLSVVKYFSDRIGVMYYGKMVELASSEELFAHPLHPYTRSLLSAIPLPDPVSEKNRQRIVYNSLAEHDYTVDKPSMREVSPGHFVYCNDAEEAKYKKELGL